MFGMEWITYSWLALCATAPSVSALSVWVLFIFHTYRRRWRTVDIFLLIIALQEIPSSLCAFGFAVHTVIRTRSESSCNLVIWGLTTTRVFQLTTLTSLAFDRALTLKWPYKYRLSVRHSQIRYHIVVLVVISALVGVAGLFARLQFQDFRERIVPPTNFPLANNTINYNSINYNNINSINSINYYCTLHPFSWDFRYNVFISSLYALLTFITFICTLYIEINRFRGQSNSRPNSRISSVGNLVGDHLGSTEAIGRCESYRTLYGFQTIKQGSITKKSLDDQKAFDLRWASVIGSLALCYSLNHGPYLAFMLTGLIVQFWNPLHDNIIVWLGIVEGLLLPIALYITDDPFRDAVKRSFRRRNYRCSDMSKSGDGPFPLYFNDFALIDKPYVGMMSSVAGTNTSALSLVSNYRRSFKGNHSNCRRSNSNDPHMRTNDSGLSSIRLSSIRKCKASKSNDRYMFLSIYGVDKVIPVNKSNSTAINKDVLNPYYKNVTTISTFAGSDNSIKKEKLDCNTIEKRSSIDKQSVDKQSSIEKQFSWYKLNASPTITEDASWESHTRADNKDKQPIDDHIYATLSETFSVKSTLPDKRLLGDQKMSLDCINSNATAISQNDPIDALQTCNKSNAASVDGFSMSGISFTTTANDDFEFTKGEDFEFAKGDQFGFTKEDDFEFAKRDQFEFTKRDDYFETMDSANHDYGCNRNDSSSASLASYSLNDSMPKGHDNHIYDNLGFELENASSLNVIQPHFTEGSSHSQGLPSSISAMNSNYVQKRCNPFVSKYNPTYYKRRGRQSFSASDLHKLDSPVYSLQKLDSPVYSLQKLDSPVFSLHSSNTNIYNVKSDKNAINDQNESHTTSPSAPRKSVSESNLLQSVNNKSMLKMNENNRQSTSKESTNRQSTSTSRETYETHSSDDSINSIRSNNTSSSWDIHCKLAQVLKKKADINSAAIRNNVYMTRAKARLRSKKYRVKKRDQNVSNGKKDTKPNQGNACNNKSVWSIENQPLVKNRPLVSLNGITRIGSYAHEWYSNKSTMNKSMPDLSSLSSLASCPSPVFSPLYRKESKSPGTKSPGTQPIE